MKILLINKFHFIQGGADRAYLDMGLALERAGHDVAYFSSESVKNLPTPWSRHFVSGISYDKADQQGFFEKVRIARDIIWNREAEKKMNQLLNEFQPDIVHLHNIYHQLSPSILRPIRRCGIPVVMTLHDYKLISPNYSLFVRGKVWEGAKDGAYWKCVRDRCVKNSRAKSIVCSAEAYIHRYIGAYDVVRTFLSPSNFLIEKFREHGFKRSIEYLPNPLIPFPEDLSRQLLAEDAPFVFIGRLSAEKGIDMLLRAFSRYKGRSCLRIVGDGPERRALESLSQELGLRSRVSFEGFLSGNNLREVRSSARAIIIPSRWHENMPYALLEAMAAGKVVIAARRGGIPEKVREGENGFLYDPEDEDSFLESIRRFEMSDVCAIQRAARASVMDLREDIFLERLMRLYG